MCCIPGRRRRRTTTTTTLIYKNIIRFFSFHFITWNIWNGRVREIVKDSWDVHTGQYTNVQWTTSSLSCFYESGKEPSQGNKLFSFLLASLLSRVSSGPSQSTKSSWFLRTSQTFPSLVSSGFSQPLNPGQSGTRPTPRGA